MPRSPLLVSKSGLTVRVIPKTRRSLARLYALVTRIANEATAALTLGENLVSALSAHMAAQRAVLELERGDRQPDGRTADSDSRRDSRRLRR